MIVMRLLSSLKHDESERGIFHLGRALVKNGHTSIIVSSANEDNELVSSSRAFPIYHETTLKSLYIDLPKFKGKTLRLEFLENESKSGTLVASSIYHIKQ